MVEKSASDQIDAIIAKHGDWKGEILSLLRSQINSVSDDIIEEVKWKTASRPEGLPVWTSQGIVCFAETWKDNVKLLFMKGAQLDDPDRLFNARLKSSTVRAIEFREGSSIDNGALKSLVTQAVHLNASRTN